jgi:hypothetical protein
MIIRNGIAHADSLWDVREQVIGMKRSDWVAAMFHAPNEEAAERWRDLIRNDARALGLRVRTGANKTNPLLCWAFDADERRRRRLSSAR